MRFFAIVLAAVCCVAAHADPLPNPAACANYQDVKTGSDADCDAAIAKETDPAVKSVLLFRRAYMIIDRGDFNTYAEALANLDEAIRLLPTNYRALHERAYLYNEYGRWAEAEKDLDAAAALDPRNPDSYRERAMSRFYLGDLQGRYDDRNTVVMLVPKHAGSLIARAIAAMWIGRFDQAKSDLGAAEALDTTSDEEKAAIAENRAYLEAITLTSGGDAAAACRNADRNGGHNGKTVIGDCTRAFLDAKTGKDKADALTIRAIAWQLAGKDALAHEDYEIAAALDPDNPARHSNLGYALVNAHHSTAAIKEFDRAIALKPDYVAYAGRASAKFNLHDLDGAYADAKTSFAMEPNVLALWIVGDVVYARTKSYDEAKQYWVWAYHMGSRDDRLIERLKNAGVPIPPPKPDEKPAIP